MRSYSIVVLLDVKLRCQEDLHCQRSDLGVKQSTVLHDKQFVITSGMTSNKIRQVGPIPKQINCCYFWIEL